MSMSIRSTGQTKGAPDGPGAFLRRQLTVGCEIVLQAATFYDFANDSGLDDDAAAVAAAAPLRRVRRV